MILAALLLASSAAAAAAGSWTFAVSGDSRNCGDVVMPAIARRAKEQGASFYWHLGDLRAIYKVDEDIQARRETADISTEAYHAMAWADFIENQIAPFGTMPFFIGVGNHETIPPKSRDEFAVKFAPWLDSETLRRQRLADDPKAVRPRTYYRWRMGGVSFLYLDNASAEQFDAEQLAWFERALARDEADPEVKTIVVGMHEALPESLSRDHSMNQSKTGERTGRMVYHDLLLARATHGKAVAVLASHSHFFMDGTFNTPYWNANGGVLPGWIVGTGGAVRYALPAEASAARQAKTKVYGYLLGRVDPAGRVSFEFQPVAEADVPPAVAAEYRPGFVSWCFGENAEGPKKR